MQWQEYESLDRKEQMKCEACNGTGKSSENEQDCFLCDGSGELCDKCGEASAEPGENICSKCRDEQ